jgi:hypothetical protein
VKRRVCESCLYFESAGFAKNGWCHHPDRRASTDVRLIVRANELACRNGWDNDLWVSAKAVTASNGDPSKPISSRAAAEVAQPGPSDLITSIVAAKTENHSYAEEFSTAPDRPVQEDVIVRQAPVLNWLDPSTEPATSLVTNPRAAILRAREQYKARRRVEGRISDRHPGVPLIASMEPDRPLEHSENESAEPTPHVQQVEVRAGYEPDWPRLSYSGHYISPVKRDEIQRPFPQITSFPEDDDRFETVPESDEPSLGALTASEDLPYADLDKDSLFSEQWSDVADHQGLEEGTARIVRRRESTIDRFFRNRRERKQERKEEFEALFLPPLDESSITSSAYDNSHYADEFGLEPLFPAIDDLEVQYQSVDTRGEDTTNYEIEPVEPQFPSGVAVREAAQRSASLFAPDIERSCRTCRDFRPSENGERGWCNNQWAFHHRRMVDADDLACENSFGCWWLPNDKFWRHDGDVSRHGQRTPRLDRWLATAEIHGDERGTTASGPAVRRRSAR